MISGRELRDTLRQMIAVLQTERQALAELDLDTIMGAANDKSAICSAIAETDPEGLDEECRCLVDTARHLNEVNRQIRNLVAANVTQRLNALTGGQGLYSAKPAYAYMAARA